MLDNSGAGALNWSESALHSGISLQPEYDKYEQDQTSPPWSWTGKTRDQRLQMFERVANFVEFFNARYATSRERTIPPCWMLHGGLVEEVTTLWWYRWLAFDSDGATVQLAQAFHTDILHRFYEHQARYFASADALIHCQSGQHRDNHYKPVEVEVVEMYRDLGSTLIANASPN